MGVSLRLRKDQGRRNSKADTPSYGELWLPANRPYIHQRQARSPTQPRVLVLARGEAPLPCAVLPLLPQLRRQRDYDVRQMAQQLYRVL